MLKSKRFNGSMIAVVVLAVILAISITAGATMAWFASQDSASTNFELGDAVLLTIANEAGSLEDGESLDLEIPAAKLLPGMQIFPTIYADVEESTTSALLRAKVTITASIDGQTIGETLKAEIENELMNQFIMKTNGWYFDDNREALEGDGYFYFVGNGDAYSFYMNTVADFSDLNAVQYAKYTRAGALLPLTGVAGDDAVEKNEAVKTAFLNKNVVVGGKTPVTAAEVDKALHTAADTTSLVIASVVTSAVTEDGTTKVAANFTGQYAHVPFLVRPIIAPIAWGNEAANVKVEIKIDFEAVQDYLVALDAQYQDTIAVLLPTLAHAKAVFNNASTENVHLVVVPVQP